MKRKFKILTHFGLVSMIILAAVRFISCEKAPSIIIIEDSEPLSDIDGNIYKSIKIGEQVWMAENLNTSHFRNGDIIPEAKTTEEWIRAGTENEPAWCYYNNDSEDGEEYAKLYNWYAINDPRGLAPENWTIPDNNEWAKLIDYLGGNKEAGTGMKSTTGWNSKSNESNSSRFTALPGGGRVYDGNFSDIGNAGIWWSSVEETALTAYGICLINNVVQGSWQKGTGLSVRALKCTSCSDDTTSRLTLAEKLRAALDLSLVSSNGKGLSAAVIMPDGETWAGVGGVSHENIKIITDTRFSAGSIEKMFAAVTIMQLIQEQKLTLEDPLYKWLPPYPYVDSTITIRQLLNHTCGLYNYVNNRDFWDSWFREPSKFWSMEAVVTTFNRAPYYPRGTGWNYSQTGYNLLKIIIRKITGSEISTVNRDRFFIPLGLANTFTSMGEKLPGNIAHGWYDTDNDLEYEDFFYMQRTPFASGIGGEVWSTAEDLAKWGRALFHDKKVVNQTSLDQMLTFYSPCTGEEFFGDGYGLGVCRFNPQLIYGLKAYGHGGHGPGYAAGCIYLLDYEVCIGIMENTDGGECIGTCLTRLVKVVTSYLGQ
jgi:uncharacterized protein (TIGR02145 family)